MRRLVPAVLIWILIWIGAALAETPGLGIEPFREVIHPGRPVVVSFTVPEDGTCSIELTDEAEKVFLKVTENRIVTAGYNAMYWNGTYNGVPVPAGNWRMIIRMNGMTAETPVAVGKMVPCLISVSMENPVAEEGDTVLLSFYSTEEGTLVLQEGSEAEPLYWDNVAAGTGEVGFQAEMAPGLHELTLSLVGEDGIASEPVSLTLEVRKKADAEATPAVELLPDYLREKAENGFTPIHTSPYREEDKTLNYWTLPMDITDEEAVWKALTAPITVLDNGKKNAEKTQVIIRSEPWIPATA